MPRVKAKSSVTPIPKAKSPLVLKAKRIVSRIVRRRTPKTQGQQGESSGQSGISTIPTVVSSASASATAPTPAVTATTQTQQEPNAAAGIPISSASTSETPLNSPSPQLEIEHPIKATFPNPKQLGNYIVGQALEDKMPVDNMQEFICRKIDAGLFYLIKTLILKSPKEAERMTKSEMFQDYQAKSLFLTEQKLLSILKEVPGVVQEHGMFINKAIEEGVTETGEKVTREVSRACLVLDCCVGHDFSPRYRSMTNLQRYVTREKKIPELEALQFFHKILLIVQRIHEQKVVHRDLKLANVILDTKSGEMSLRNFCLGTLLFTETELLKEQKGSPAYIAPEIIRGVSYLGKPIDMWALGVILFTMLYGRFPFYDPQATELFRKIKEETLEIPTDSIASEDVIDLIKSLLSKDPMQRPTVSEALLRVSNLLNSEIWGEKTESQIVPVCQPGAVQRCYVEVDLKSIGKESTDPIPDGKKSEENRASERLFQMQP